MSSILPVTHRTGIDRLAIALFIVDVFSPTHGVLIGGIVAFSSAR